MSEDTPPARPSSHRAPGARSSLQRLLPPVASVAVVVLVIVLLLVLNHRPTDTAGPALVTPTPTSASPSPSPSPTPPPTVSPTATATPRPVAAPIRPVWVLNNSRRFGLAHEVARQVEARGWPVAHVGNFTGRVVESTLYYAPGQLASARRLAHELSGIRRVRPRFAGLPGSGLTLVVTRDWPSS